MTTSPEAGRALADGERAVADYLYCETEKFNNPISMSACIRMAKHIATLRRTPAPGEAGRPLHPNGRLPDCMMPDGGECCTDSELLAYAQGLHDDCPRYQTIPRPGREGIDDA